MSWSPRAARWARGDHVVLRYVLEGRIWAAAPAILVQDELDLAAIYTPPGASGMRAGFSNYVSSLGLEEPDWAPQQFDSFNHVLRLIFPDVSHSVHLIWREEGWELICWYVNLEEPTTRTAIGFDTWDQQLDIVIRPDFSGWRWKDEDHFEEVQSLGLISPERANELRDEGLRVIGRMDQRRPPFNGGWERWRPDPSWGMPELPSGWDLA